MRQRGNWKFWTRYKSQIKFDDNINDEFTSSFMVWGNEKLVHLTSDVPVSDKVAQSIHELYKKGKDISTLTSEMNELLQLM